MNELVKALQSRIADLERELAHYEAARKTLGVEIDYWRGKALGVENRHQAAIRERA